MKNGKYTVQSWTGKDAVLVHEDGTFEVLAKVEFPASFKDAIYVGEIIIVETTQAMRPEAITDDERERSGHVNYTKEFQRMKDLQMKEASRRARYGGVASLENK